MFVETLTATYNNIRCFNVQKEFKIPKTIKQTTCRQKQANKIDF